MEIKQATERCKELIKPEHANWIGISNQTAIETVLQALENSIPRQVVEEKIEELDNQIKEVTNNIENSVDEEKAYWKKEKHDLIMQRYVLQELLE